MMPPTLPSQIGRVALAAVFATHPECYVVTETLAQAWWDLLSRLITAPADDVDLVWADLVALSEFLCEAPVRPRQEIGP
jgi:hypothetical protein